METVITTTYGIDTKQNGLFELLAVDVEVKAKSAADYTIHAVLRDTDGQLIGRMDRAETLVVGQQIIALNFDGRTIYRRKGYGPSRLELVIADQVGIEQHHLQAETRPSV